MNRIDAASLFHYMQLRDQGFSADEIEQVMIDPLLRELEEEEQFLQDSLQERVQIREQEGNTLLDEASKEEITKVARLAITEYQRSVDDVQANIKKTSDLLDQAIQDQKRSHEKKTKIEERLQKQRATLRRMGNLPLWAEDTQRLGEAISKGMAKRGGES